MCVARSHDRVSSHAPSIEQVVAIQNVLQLGLAQMSLTGATRIAQCSSLTITSISAMPMQVRLRDPSLICSKHRDAPWHTVAQLPTPSEKVFSL